MVEERRAAASLATKGKRVDVCEDTGECVDICDTLSQQMYVISFRRVRWGDGGIGREKKRGNERKLQDLAESGARGLL